MKKIFISILLIALITITTIIPGCIVDEEKEGEESEGDLLPITIVDDMGNLVNISKYPEKIISLSPSCTEILFELGLGDKIIGVDTASNYPAAAKNITPVIKYETNGFIVDKEKVVELNPDIVFLHHLMDLSYGWRDAIGSKAKGGLGIDYVVFNPITIEDVMDNIELTGKITNRVTEAKNLIDAMDKKITEIEDDVSGRTDNTTLKVLYVTYYDGNTDPWVSGRDTYMDSIIDKVGAKNVVQSFEGVNLINLEKIVSGNPDIIICSQSTEWPTQTKKTILDDTIFKSTNAVKTGHVYEIDGDIIDRPGPRIVDGLEAVNNIVKNF